MNVHGVLSASSVFTRQKNGAKSTVSHGGGCMYGLLAVLACGALLAMGSVTDAESQELSIADHVVINEVEIGDESGGDWIELYNPTEKSVNIGGWIISSFLRGGGSFTIPNGTVLESGEFQVYEDSKDWFSYKSSIVQLRGEGVLVDYTTLISDLKRDSNTWARIADGHSTTSERDWLLGAPTRGAPNAESKVPQPDLLSIKLENLSKSYTFGQTIRIAGSVPEIVPNPILPSVPSSMKVTISGQGGARTATLYPDRDLNFEYVLQLRPTLGFDEGAYVANVSYSTWSVSAEFEISKVPDVEAPKPVPKYVQISADARSYNLGQTVTISGNTNVQEPHATMSYHVRDPDGELYKSGKLFPKQDGTFQTQFELVLIGTPRGTYDATFEYAGVQANLEFGVDAIKKPKVPIEITFDKKAYGTNSTVKMTGIIHDSTVPAVAIIVQQISSTPDAVTGHLDKTTGSARTVNGENFYYEYTIYDNPDRFGKYKVLFSSKNHNEEKFFVVVPNPDSYVKTIAPLTLLSDRRTYNVGDTIEFAGVVNPEDGHVQGGQVRITMTDPGGKKLTTASAKEGLDKVTKTVVYALTDVPDQAGQYMVSGTLFRSLFTAGTFEATADYANGLYAANVTFNVVDPISEGKPFALHVDKNPFGAGQRVVITAEAPGLEIGSPVHIVLHKPDGSTEEFVVLSDESSFDWSWSVPSALTRADQGVYRAVVSTDRGMDQAEFTVGAATAVTAEVGGTLMPGGAASITGSVAGPAPESAQITVRVYEKSNPEETLYAKHVDASNNGSFALDVPLPVSLWSGAVYEAEAKYGEKHARAEFELEESSEKPVYRTAKFSNIRQTQVEIPIGSGAGENEHPRILKGTLVSGPYGSGTESGMSLISPSGTCIVGADAACLVSSMTKITAKGPYKKITVDGVRYNVRYSGPDANIERFTILPAADGQTFEKSEWSVRIDDAGLPTKFHYKIKYVN